MEIAGWTPPEWVYNIFPLPVSNSHPSQSKGIATTEVVSMEFLLEVMGAGIDGCTEWDSAPLGPILHMAHMLVAHQGSDGLWASALNLRTGDDATDERTGSPVDIFDRLNEILGSTEFDFAIRRARAGISSQNRERCG